MYVREEDIFHAIYRQLKDYVTEHYITDVQHKQQVQEFTAQIADLTRRNTKAWTDAMEHYERFVQGEISREEFRAVQDIADEAKELLTEAVERRTAYEMQYTIFRKLLSASCKDIPLSGIMDCIDKVVVDSGRKIVVEWS